MMHWQTCEGEVETWEEQDDNWRYFKGKCNRCDYEYSQKTKKIYFVEAKVMNNETVWDNRKCI